MRLRAFLLFLIVTSLIGLTPVAFADPPDPAWLAGYWDDDDFDSLAVFIVGDSTLDAGAPGDAVPVVVHVATVEIADPIVHPAPFHADLRPRAPPLGSLSHS